MTGKEYRQLVARYLSAAYGVRGLRVYEEVSVGTSIIGKQRRLDLLAISSASLEGLAIECKFQDSSGTADEKIPYTLQDLAALRLPSVVVYGGVGFSEGVLHMLQASEIAAYCMPDAETLAPQPRRAGDSIDSGTWQLDHVLALTFRWWDVLIAGKEPVAP